MNRVENKRVSYLKDPQLNDLMKIRDEFNEFVKNQHLITMLQSMGIKYWTNKILFLFVFNSTDHLHNLINNIFVLLKQFFPYT